MAYQALYRQWRPKNFSEMVSQETVVTTLKNQVAVGRVAHAYLFCGSRGTGKTSTAKIMARAINCTNPRNGDPCGECDTCRRLLEGETLDVVEIDAASNNGVDEIRTLRDTIKYLPQQEKYKVYIIDEVHMLSTSAFNALLKTLEEPPEYVVFILATTEPQKLPATVLSRCQRFDFGRIPAVKIAGRLREAVTGAGAEATDDALMMIARAAEGGMRDGLSILDMCLGYGRDVDADLVRQVLGTSDRSFLFRFSEALTNEDAAVVMSLVDQLMRDGREPMVFAKEMAQHLRALLLAKCCPEEMADLLEIPKEDADAYVHEAGALTQSRIMAMMNLFMHCETELRYVSSPRLALETAALRACLRTSEADAAALQDRITELEKKLDALQQNGVAVAAPAAGTSTAPIAPKAPAVPAARPDEKAVEIWRRVRPILRKTDEAILTQLEQGLFVNREGNTFTWQPSDGNQFLLVILNKEDRKKKIEAAFTEVVGEPCTFRGINRDTRQPEAPAGKNDPLEALRNTFGRSNVSVQE